MASLPGRCTTVLGQPAPGKVIVQGTGAHHGGVQQGGSTSAYLLDPTILRRIKAIDPRLDIEWRPKGEWWTSYVEYKGKRPAGATPGCWRITLTGRSGEVKGLRLWHPEMADDRLVQYLREHHGMKVSDPRRYGQTQALYNEDLRKQQEQERFLNQWNRIDHGAMRRATKASWEAPKWRGNWNVAAEIS